MVAAFGGVVPLDGCVALAGGLGGKGAVEDPGSFAPSGGSGNGGVGLTGGFTSPSWACCFGVAGEGGPGEGATGACV